MRRLTLLLMASLSLAFAHAPFPKEERDPNKAELAKLQGRWLLVSNVVTLPEGRVLLTNVVGAVSFAGNRMVQGDYPENWRGWHIGLNARTRPKQIDFISNRGLILWGVYSLDGDTLTICWAERRLSGRPKDLTGKQVGQWVEVYKRVKQ
jgi:uncharacterized protein (TIGR03067 family)